MQNGLYIEPVSGSNYESGIHLHQQSPFHPRNHKHRVRNLGEINLRRSKSLYPVLDGGQRNISNICLSVVPSRITRDRGVASRKILQLCRHQSVNPPHKFSCQVHHSSNSTLKVLAFENMLSYAPMRVRIASTGQSLESLIRTSFWWLGQATDRADSAGTRIPSCAMIYAGSEFLFASKVNVSIQHPLLSSS